MLSSCGVLPLISVYRKFEARRIFRYKKHVHMYGSEHSTDYLLLVVVSINTLVFLGSFTSVYKTSAWLPSINPCLHQVG